MELTCKLFNTIPVLALANVGGSTLPLFVECTTHAISLATRSSSERIASATLQLTWRESAKERFKSSGLGILGNRKI